MIFDLVVTTFSLSEESVAIFSIETSQEFIFITMLITSVVRLIYCAIDVYKT